MSDTELNEILEGHVKEKAALLLRVAELEGSAAAVESRAETLRKQLDNANEYITTQKQQLVAATNDAARLREMVDAAPAKTREELVEFGKYLAATVRDSATPRTTDDELDVIVEEIVEAHYETRDVE